MAKIQQEGMEKNEDIFGKWSIENVENSRNFQINFWVLQTLVSIWAVAYVNLSISQFTVVVCRVPVRAGI